MTQPVPSSEGSDCSIRVRMPSVTTSMRAPGTPRRGCDSRRSADGLAQRLGHALGRGGRQRQRGSSMTMRPRTTSSSASNARGLARAGRHHQDSTAMRSQRGGQFGNTASMGGASVMGRGIKNVAPVQGQWINGPSEAAWDRKINAAFTVASDSAAQPPVPAATKPSDASVGQTRRRGAHLIIHISHI